MSLGTTQKANQRTEKAKDKCNNSSKSFQCVLNEERKTSFTAFSWRPPLMKLCGLGSPWVAQTYAKSIIPLKVAEGDKKTVLD